MNPAIIEFLRFTHISAGTIALVVAPVAMVVQKGGRAHRLWGKVFFWCMTLVFITAVIMAFYHWIPFLLMIAFFSFYSVFVVTAPFIRSSSTAARGYVGMIGQQLSPRV